MTETLIIPEYVSDPRNDQDNTSRVNQEHFPNQFAPGEDIFNRYRDGAHVTPAEYPIELRNNNYIPSRAPVEPPNPESEDVGLYRRLRDSYNANRTQTYFQICWTLIPFLILIAIKLLIEDLVECIRLIGGYLFFVYTNHELQQCVRRENVPRWKYARLICLTILFTYFTGNHAFTIADYSLLNVLTFSKSGIQYNAFLFTLKSVLLSAYFMKMCTVSLKLIVSLFSKGLISKKQKSRLYQLIEYASQIYGIIIPTVQWTYYFFGNSATGIFFHDCILSASYVYFKFREIRDLSKEFYISLREALKVDAYLFTPTIEDMQYAFRCPICHDQFSDPAKLKCDHVFCRECIDSWLDKMQTCPICRRAVEISDNAEWTDGATSKIVHFCLTLREMPYL